MAAKLVILLLIVALTLILSVKEIRQMEQTEQIFESEFEGDSIDRGLAIEVPEDAPEGYDMASLADSSDSAEEDGDNSEQS